MSDPIRTISDLPDGTRFMQVTFVKTDGDIDSSIQCHPELANNLTLEAVRGIMLYVIQKSAQSEAAYQLKGENSRG